MRVVRQFTALLLTRWGSLGMGLAAAVISARALGPERQGAVILLLSAIDIAAVFLGAGLPTSGAYLLKQGHHTLGEVVAAIAAFYAGVGVAVVVLAWIGRDLIGVYAPGRIGISLDLPSVGLLVALLVGTLFSSMLGPLLIVGDRTRIFASWSVTSQALGLVLTWCLLVPLRMGVKGALAANMSMQVVTICALVYWLKDSALDGRLRFRGSVLLQALRVGAKQWQVSSFATLFKKGDSLILAALLDVRSVGYYSVASSLYDLVIDVPRTLVWPMVREIAERGAGTREQLAAKSIRIQIPASIVLAIGAAIVIPLGLPILYGDAYQGAVIPFVVLMGGVPLRAVTLGLSAYFIATGFPGAMLLPMTAAAATSLGLDLVAVPSLGVAGAAATTIVGELVLAILSLRALAHATDISVLRALVPRRSDVLDLIRFPGRLLRTPAGVTEDGDQAQE